MTNYRLLMKKTVFLVRHAQAAEPEIDQKDIARPLTPAGMRDAGLMGRYLFQNYENPNLILSSTAARAQTTAEMIAEQLKYDASGIRFDEDLYEASVRTLLRIINEVPDQYHSILIVAHNPSITYLAEYLSKSDVPNMYPGSVCILEFEDLHWKEVSEGTGYFKLYESPPNLLE